MCVVPCCREVGSCFESGKRAERSPNQAAPCLGRASVAPEIVRTCRVASYQGAPFSRLLTSNHLSISNRSPLRFDTAIDDRLLRPSEKGGVLTYRVEVSSVPDKSWFTGLYPEREVYARSGWILVSATVDHAARLPFCTKDYLSLFTHPSCEVGIWFGSSMGVASALF